MSTRNSINKYLTTECYKASKEFPPGRLPTLKQVLERCLFFKEYRTESVQREVSEELHNLWTKYNVYPISTNAIQMRLNNHIKEFSRLLNYDEKKQGPKFKMDALKFIEESNKLFDIYQKDHKILAAAEKKYLLKMTDDDHKFYEDQKTARKGYCTSKIVPLTPSEIKFKRRIQETESEKKSTKTDYFESKPSCSHQLLPDQESPISASEENTQQSDDELVTEVSDFDPDYTPDGLSEQQNRMELRTLAEACDRYQISDRAGAAIASSVLVDFGLITKDKMQNVIDKNKLRRERNKLRKERQKEEENMFENITGIGFDGRRDATLQISEVNGKYYTSTILEEHYVITGEPDDFYLDHFSPESGKGIDIAHGIYKKVCGTELQERLFLVKADGTNVNTGHKNGSIRYLEIFLGKPLQHDICLLHLNELPLRHVFMKLDGITKGPDKFAGSIGSKLNGNVSEWEVVKFKPIPYNGFILLDNETLDSLSTDQYYAYRICWSIITGDVDDDLALLEVGPINHSRWLTLACRILRYYTSLVKPSKNLKLIAEFIVTVYFPSWFHIKVNKKLTDGTRNLFSLIKRVNMFPDKNIREICYKILDNNSYFAHGENILVAMLADEEEEVRRRGVNKLLHIKGSTEIFTCEDDDFEGGVVESEDIDESEDDDETKYPPMNKGVRTFLKPKINFKASSYYKMTPSFQWETIPPILNTMSEAEIKNFIDNPLKVKHECHSQNVERHIKLVTEASMAVVGHDRRDGLIRNKIRSRKLMKNFASKSHFKF